MKARIKSTGEIMSIAEYAKVPLESCDSWGNPIEKSFDEIEIVQERTDNIDWEQRRYEIAKEIMAGYVSNNIFTEVNDNTLAGWSVLAADALIEQLKQPKQ